MNNIFSENKQINREVISIVLIMFAATFMRFYNLAGWSLSNDELSALNRLRFDSFSDMITHGVKLGDFHPAGVQALLWFWIKLFGDSVWVVRLPFVIFGTASVWLTCLIGKKWFGTSTGLFAAAALAFLQYPILYSQLARPYAPGLFFSLATVWYWTEIVFGNRRTIIHYAGFALMATLSAYTHHYSFLFVIVVGISGFFFHKNLQLKKYLPASLAAAILYLPHIPVFLYQFGIGGVGGEEGWLDKPDPDWIVGYLWFAFNKSSLIILIVCLILVFSVFQFRNKFTKYHVLAIGWFITMFLIGYLYSLWRNPILQFSILIFSFPFLLLFIFSFLNQKIKTNTLFILFIFLGVGISQTFFINKYYQKQHFGEFRDIAQKIARWNMDFGNKNVSNAIVVNGPYYIHYYLDKLDADVRFVQYKNDGSTDMLSLIKILDSVSTPYFSYAWTKPAPAEIDPAIREKYPCVLEQKNYSGLSGVTLYAKAIQDSCIHPPEPVFVFRENFNNLQYSPEPASSISASDSGTFKMDSLTEYAPGFTGRANQINQGDFNSVEIKVSAYSQGEIKNTILVLSLENDNGIYLWRGSQLQNFIVPGSWGKAFLSYTFTEQISENDVIRIYCWNPGKGEILIDDFEVRFY